MNVTIAERSAAVPSRSSRDWPIEPEPASELLSPTLRLGTVALRLICDL